MNVRCRKRRVREGVWSDVCKKMEKSGLKRVEESGKESEVRCVMDGEIECMKQLSVRT